MDSEKIRQVALLISLVDGAMKINNQQECFELLKQFDDFKNQNQEFFRSEFPMELQNKEEFEQKEKKLASFVFENFLAKNLNINFEDKNIGSFKYQNGGFEIFGFRKLIIYEIPNDFNFYFKNCEFQGIPVRRAMEDWSNDAISFGSDLKNVRFYRCKFLQLVIFDQSEIYASFDQCYFIKGILCESSTGICFKKALFNRCRFYKTADFSKVKFDCNCDFSSIVVCDANFSNAIFTNKALFSSAKFVGANFNSANFVSSTFEEDAVFNNTKFRRDANFNESKFKKNTSFSKSNFYKIANFTRASFGTSEKNFEIDLKDCQFKDKSIFSNARFYDSAYFNNTAFKKEVDFHESEFNKIICFYNTDFEKIPNFSACVFEKPKLANFVGVDLSKIEKRDIEQYISKKAEVESKLEENKEKKRTQEELRIQHSRNIKDSFRVIKDILLTQNNKLEAQTWHKLELYAKEVEIEYLLEDSKRYKKQDSKKVGLIFDKCILGFYRLISEHHNDFGKILNTTVGIIVFHSVFIFMLKYLLFTNLFSLEKFDESFVALFFIPIVSFFMLFVSIAGICRYFKKRFISRLFGGIAFYLLIVFVAIYLSILVLVEKDPSYLHYLVFSIVCVYCSILSIAFLIPKIFAVRIVLYALFSCIFFTSPEALNPSLGIFKENPLNNTILKHYIEENDFVKIQNFLRNCNWFKEKLDSRINDYYSLQEILPQNSRTFLRICGKEQANANKEKKDNKESKNNVEDNEIALILIKNELFNQTLACINVIYLLMLILCIFSLQKVPRKNSIIPS